MNNCLFFIKNVEIDGKIRVVLRKYSIKMANVLIKIFQSGGSPSIPVHVFIKNLPQKFTAIFHSAVEIDCCSWFIVYSVQTNDGRTEYFYEKFSDSNESSDYVLNIHYDSSKAFCSFDSTERIVFVDSDNDPFSDQNQPMFYECVIHNEFKIFLVIFQNNIVLFWNNNYEEVIVKTLNFSSFLDLCKYDFTRVVINPSVNLLYGDSCKITFCTDPSDSNTYFSAYLDIESFLESNEEVSIVLKYHRFDQMCSSQFNGSQFKPDINKRIGDFTLKLSHFVDGSEVVSEAGSDEGSEAGSEAGSDEDSDEDSDDERMYI